MNPLNQNLILILKIKVKKVHKKNQIKIRI
jgi:hypothetical protein